MVNYLSKNKISKRSFLHYLGIHFLELKGVSYQYNRLLKEAELATKIALLGSEQVFITLASYIESKFCREVISPYSPLFEFGSIVTVGGGINVEEFLYNKIAQYSHNKFQYDAYRNIDISNLPPFLPRKSSASTDIIHDWRDILHKGLVPKIFETNRYTPNRSLENNWETVPDLLGPDAFIVENVSGKLFPDRNNIHELNCLHNAINKFYFESFTNELNAGLIRELVWLEASSDILSFDVDIPFQTIIKLANKYRFLGELQNIPCEQIFSLQEHRNRSTNPTLDLF